MTSGVKLLPQNFAVDRAELEGLKTIAIFCGIGLVASLFWAIYDLNPGVGFN